MIEVRELRKTFRNGATEVRALDGVSLDIRQGDIFGIVGSSGSGKSTLLRCINLLERPDSGTVSIAGTKACALDRRALGALRRRVGMIFHPGAHGHRRLHRRRRAGQLAIRCGHQRFRTDVMLATAAILVVLVSAIQLTGNQIAKAMRTGGTSMRGVASQARPHTPAQEQDDEDPHQRPRVPGSGVLSRPSGGLIQEHPADLHPSRADTMSEAYWLPFTPNRDFAREPKSVVRAKELEYWTASGRRVLDFSSGLFCVAAGHGREEIAEAVRHQLKELDFIPAFLRSHPAAFELARRIADLTPPGLDAVFFSSSGSEAVDTAMKIVLAFHRARGQGHRTLFVSRERAYHGVGFGGVALSGIANNRRVFGPGLPAAVHLRHTHLDANRFQPGEGQTGAELADDLLRIIHLHGAENIAAVFIEPIAGSTGCLVPPRGYLQRLRQICDQHGLLLVFDEVITGLGRTGAAFASQSFGVTPDVITLAKAITNGAQPLAATVVRAEIRQAILDAQPNLSAPELFHGYTYSAHPAAVAAGLATLDIYSREHLFDRAKELSPYFLEALWTLRDLPIVTDLRGYGLLAGLEIAGDGTPGNRGYQLQKRLFDAGLHLKTTGDAAILAPAYVATKGQIDEGVEIIRRVLKTL